MTQFVEFFVVFPLFNAVGFWRDDNVNARLFEKVKHAFFCIEGFVCKQGFDFFKNPRQEDIRSFEIMCLPRCEMKARGIAQGIATGMYLGGQPAFAATNGFALADIFGLLPLFLRAPAEC